MTQNGKNCFAVKAKNRVKKPSPIGDGFFEFSKTTS